MNKEHFLALLQDSSLGKTEIPDIELLSVKHPYSQPIRALMARSSKGVSKELYQHCVTVAALYASERSALKKFIESPDKPSIPRKVKGSSPTQKTTEGVKRQVKLKISESKPASSKVVRKEPLVTRPQAADSIEKLREEVLHNLQELQKHKSDLDILLKDLDKEKPKQPKKKKPSATKKTTAKTAGKSTQTKKEVKPQNESKIEPGEKDELIEKFIKESPSITPKKKFEGEQIDLAKKSVTFNEDIVSENLAEIFARQGKIKKAEEIYRKLIWKFPQKKAFFASRIEEIKLRN